MVWVGLLAGVVGGVGTWRWLRPGGYRYAGERTRLDLSRAWLVVPLTAAAGAGAGLAPLPLVAAAVVYMVVGAGVAWIDWDVHRVPDAVTRLWAPAVAVVVVVSAAVTGDWRMLLWSLVGAGVLGGVFLMMALFTSMGLGDVKLAAITGLVVGPLGWNGLFTAVLGAYLVGAVVAVVLLARGAPGRSHLAFGPWIVAGAAIALATGSLA